MHLGVLASGLRRDFGGHRALDGLDLRVAPGTVGALLGPNGAGKTTTVRILTTLERADSGQAFVAGFDVAAAPLAVRASISLTGQYAAVDGDLTGRENLVMIARLRHRGRREARRRADELLDRFQLTGAADRITRTYSGGMRRRLDLAASLVTTPKVLFLDEPTTGLDPPSRDGLWDVVRELRDQGTAIVLTTQYLEEADQLADRITLIDHGTAVADGTPAELKAVYGGDVLELIGHDDHSAYQAAKHLVSRAGLGEASIVRTFEEPRVDVRLPAGTYSVWAAVRELSGEGIELRDIRLRRTSLDEVFAVLTTPKSRS
ncbi:ATP-binding cassette domain-containing protein [Dactylosporangium sp. NPDC005572]|uniref:ATP-binding cassette domain-containing protein n=1 Tax=Dactylosporangium sp. NPDC005572 TaxID=3156889 RepID=UPI00339E1B77